MQGEKVDLLVPRRKVTYFCIFQSSLGLSNLRSDQENGIEVINGRRHSFRRGKTFNRPDLCLLITSISSKTILENHKISRRHPNFIYCIGKTNTKFESQAAST